MDKLSELLRDMRAHRTDHGRQTSDTVQAWADRLEQGLVESVIVPRELVDDDLLRWAARRMEGLERDKRIAGLVRTADETLAGLEGDSYV